MESLASISVEKASDAEDTAGEMYRKAKNAMDATREASAVAEQLLVPEQVEKKARVVALQKVYRTTYEAYVEVGIQSKIVAEKVNFAAYNVQKCKSVTIVRFRKRHAEAKV
jgi:hypothetical protein